MDRIPESILAHILTFLPSRDLVRDQLVEKKWQRLILSHHFARCHLRNFLPNNLETELFVTQGANRQCVLRSSTTLTQTTYILDTLGSPAEFGNWQYHHSTDGIILLTQYPGDFNRSSLMLWNPSIHKTLLLPDPPIPPELDLESINQADLGLAYMQGEPSYRVIKLVFYNDWLSHIALYTVRTEQWTIKEHTEQPFPWRWELLLTSATTYQHHLISTYNNDTLYISQLLAFDIDTDSIFLLPCPPATNDPPYQTRPFTIIVLDGGTTLGFTDFESGIWTFEPAIAPLQHRSWQQRYAFAITPSSAPHMTLHNEIVLQPTNTCLACSLPVNGTLIAHAEIAQRYILDANEVYYIILPTAEYIDFRSISAHFNNLALLNNTAATTKLLSSYPHHNHNIESTTESE